jgi:hypothetical protein
MIFALPGILSQTVDERLFDLLDIPARIILDGAISANFTLNGFEVTQWQNLADNSYPANQPSQANRPLFVPNFINGKGAVLFDGVNDSVNFQINNVKGCWSNRYSAFTITMVVFPQTSTNTGQIFGTGASSTVAIGTAMDVLPNGNLFTQNKSNSTGTRQTLQITNAVNLFDDWQIIIWSGFNLNTFGASFTRINGGGLVFDNATDLSLNRPFAWSANNHLVSLRLGGFTANQFFKGYVADFRYFPKAFNLSTIELVEGWYATRYNLRSKLPNNHPYKLLAPVFPDNPYFYRDIPTKNL